MCDYSRLPDEKIREIDIHGILPQRAPFVMIGRLEHFDMRTVITSTLITEDNIFVSDRHFSSAGIIENIAQTCAARIGYINKYILKKGIQIGYIGAVSNLNIHSLPEVGTTIKTVVTVQEEIFGMILASATVTAGDEIIASTGIKIALSDREVR